LESSFQDEFVAALNLPHATETFPHIQEFLPAADAGEPPKNQARARRKLDRQEQLHQKTQSMR
jgi:uncharacterized 2Fe-2S/4Fe-4S cluster protein (DUF4445 family)